MYRAQPDIAEVLFILPPDAKFVPVAELSDRLRSSIGPIELGQSVLTRPGFRVTTRLIPAPLAALLREFCTPSLLTDGVLRFARANGQDPFATLDLAFDALGSLIEARLLVPHDSPDAAAPTPSFASGQQFAGYEIERLIRSLEDSEVYRARGPDNRVAALKVSRDDRPDVVARIANEARFLELLEGATTPSLLDTGIVCTRAYIATEWFDGISIASAAQRWRAARDRRQLQSLVGQLFKAYAELHRNGVLHGDIHPGNCLVDDDGRVVILDFGNAQSIANTRSLDPWRSGIPHFFDPQMAEAVLAARLPPAATALSEQYALAAMAYLLLTGLSPITATAIRDELLQRIVSRPPLPFAARGVPAWPQVESVIGRGMAKLPNDRFPDVAKLGSAFSSAAIPRNDWPRWPSATQLTFDDAIWAIRRLAPSADPFRTVWFAIRSAFALEDAELLAAADILSRRAGSGWAANSLSALVARARSDSRSEDQAILGFLEAAERLHKSEEICTAIWAASTLLEGVMFHTFNAEALAEWATQQLKRLTDIACKTEFVAGSEEPVLIHLALSLCKAGVAAPPASLQARLEELAEVQGDHFWLWALAHDVFADDRFKSLTANAGLSHAPLERGFQFLRLHQLDGTMHWVSKASSMVAKAPCAGLPAVDRALLMVELLMPEKAVLPPFVLPFRMPYFSRDSPELRESRRN